MKHFSIENLYRKSHPVHKTVSFKQEDYYINALDKDEA